MCPLGSLRIKGCLLKVDRGPADVEPQNHWVIQGTTLAGQYFKSSMVVFRGVLPNYGSFFLHWGVPISVYVCIFFIYSEGFCFLEPGGWLIFVQMLLAGSASFSRIR